MSIRFFLPSYQRWYRCFEISYIFLFVLHPLHGRRFGSYTRDFQARIPFARVSLQLAVHPCLSIVFLNHPTCAHLEICPSLRLQKLDLSLKFAEPPISTTTTYQREGLRRSEIAVGFLTKHGLLIVRNNNFHRQSGCVPLSRTVVRS